MLTRHWSVMDYHIRCIVVFTNETTHFKMNWDFISRSIEIHITAMSRNTRGPLFPTLFLELNNTELLALSIFLYRSSLTILKHQCVSFADESTCIDKVRRINSRTEMEFQLRSIPFCNSSSNSIICNSNSGTVIWIKVNSNSKIPPNSDTDWSPWPLRTSDLTRHV